MDFFKTVGSLMTFRFLEIINLAILDKKTVRRVMVMGNMLKYEPQN